jgi:hypothetical protein
VKPDEPGRGHPESLPGPLTARIVGGTLLCLVLLILIEGQLLLGTRRLADGGVGRALWNFIVHRQQPADPSAVWYQVSAPIAKASMDSLPAVIRARAEPAFDWLHKSGGLQRATIVRILLDGDDLTIDLYGGDEAACRLVLQATRRADGPINLIGVAGSSSDLMATPTGISDEKQCERRTSYLRMINSPHAMHKN